MSRSAERRRDGRALVAYLVLAFALSWSWWLPQAFAGETVRRGDGWPTHIPGLLGPLLAALIVSAVQGRAALRAWAASLVRLPRDRRWGLAALVPLAFLALGLLIRTITGDLPPARELWTISGAAPGAAFALALLVNVIGEEAGWRGFALPRLERRLGALRGSVVLGLIWGAWHLPLFWLLASYQGFSPMTVPGFFIGIVSGSIVLAAVYNRTGASVLACAAWHASYNMAAATTAADGLIAALATAGVIGWAVALVQRERSGEPALGRVPGAAPG